MKQTLVALWFPGGAYKGLVGQMPVSGIFSDSPDVGHASLNVDGVVHVSIFPSQTIPASRLHADVEAMYSNDLGADCIKMSREGESQREYDECYVIDNLDVDALADEARRVKATSIFNTRTRNCSTLVGRLLLGAFDRYYANLSMVRKAKYVGQIAAISVIRAGTDGVGPLGLWSPEAIRSLTRAIMEVTGGTVEKGAALDDQWGDLFGSKKAGGKVGW